MTYQPEPRAKAVLLNSSAAMVSRVNRIRIRLAFISLTPRPRSRTTARPGTRCSTALCRASTPRPRPARLPPSRRSVRYVRDYLNGSTANTGNHWVEIEAYGSRTTAHIANYYEVGDFLRKPVWSFDGSLLYGLAGGGSYMNGNPAYWDLENGEFKKCSRDLPFFQWIEWSGNQENLKEVLIGNAYSIIIMDLTKCKLINKLVDYSGDHTKHVSGLSLYQATQELLYGLITFDQNHLEKYAIIKLDLKIDKFVVLTQGISPSWSPDGSQIAYVGVDGIYIMNSDGSNSRLLVKHQFLDPREAGTGDDQAMPRWSLDGKWIIYYRCDGRICATTDATIYKVGSVGGQEEKIIDGGAFPSWKP